MKNVLNKHYSGIAQDETSHYPFGPRAYQVKVSRMDPQHSQLSFFSEKARAHARAAHERGTLAENVCASPLCNLIARSFIVATERDLLLFASKDALPRKEMLQKISLKSLINIKALAIQTYGYISELVRKGYVHCPSRNGSQCLFRERLESPGYSVRSNRLNRVANDMLRDECVILLGNTIEEMLRELSKAKPKHEHASNVHVA